MRSHRGAIVQRDGRANRAGGGGGGEGEQGGGDHGGADAGFVGWVYSLHPGVFALPIDIVRRSIAALRSRDLYEYAQYVAMYGMWRGLEWTRPYPGTRVRGDSVSMIIPSEALRKRRSLCARARVRSARDTVWKFSHSCAAVDNSQT